jgi:glycosyltransferase involved in cell wall biosynthesis
MKKILIIPVKNEEWILEHTLTCASLFFDHIIIADEKSTDDTPDIYKKFPKVIYFQNEAKTYDEGNRRQILLEAARKIEGYNFIAHLAADEVFSANILDDTIFDEMVEGKAPGTSFSFQWVQLWRSEGKYRDDKSVWSNFDRPFAFIDDRLVTFEPGFAHLSIIPEALVLKAISVPHIKVLHYQFVDFARILRKQRWAKLLEFGHYTQPIFLKSFILNNKYYVYKDEARMKLADTPASWLSMYPPYVITEDSSQWHVSKGVEFIRTYSANILYWLDIWDYQWPAGITDKRNRVQKFYHNHQRLIYVVNEYIPKPIKKLIKKIKKT